MVTSDCNNDDDSSFLRLRIIQINDVYKLDAFPNLSTLVQQELFNDTIDITPKPDAVAFVLCGDFVAPSLLSSLDGAHSMIDCLNALGLTHVCLGNHESDIAMPVLAKRIQQSHFVWLNSNMPELNQKINVDTPLYDVIEVTKKKIDKNDSSDHYYTKRVALLGLLTDEKDVYRPGAFGGATIEPVIETTRRLLQRDLSDKKVDLVIPLTHQDMTHDVAFGRAFGGDTFPIILGGHDHATFFDYPVVAAAAAAAVAGQEQQEQQQQEPRLFKVGMDAENAGIIDICWPCVDESSAATATTILLPTITARMVSVADYPPDPAMEQRVAQHITLLDELEQAKLFRIQKLTDLVLSDTFHGQTFDTLPRAALFSTRHNRFEPTIGSMALTTMLRMGLRTECALLNAGAIRGQSDYKQDSFFSWSDLKKEMPFKCAMTATYLPGHVLQDMITHSRQDSWGDPPEENGGYLHTCTNIHYNNTSQCIESIHGDSFDPQKMYLTALPEEFFDGIDNHKALLAHMAASSPGRGLDEDAAIPAKILVVEVLSTLVWLELGSFDELDADGDNAITRDEIAARVVEIFGPQISDIVIDNIMSVADPDGNGIVDRLEMMATHYVATDMMTHIPKGAQMDALLQSVKKVLGDQVVAADASGVDKEKVYEENLLRLRSFIDNNDDGEIQRNELRRATGSLSENQCL